jgi:hypothetical protein
LQQFDHQINRWVDLLYFTAAAAAAAAVLDKLQSMAAAFFGMPFGSSSSSCVCRDRLAAVQLTVQLLQQINWPRTAVEFCRPAAAVMLPPVITSSNQQGQLHAERQLNLTSPACMLHLFLVQNTPC